MTTAALRVLVVTIVHDPEDARIRYRQIPALLAAGHSVTYAAPFAAFDRDPPPDVTAVDLSRAAGRRRLKAIREARGLIRRLRTEVDLVLIHDPELLLAVERLAGLPPVVWDVHEDTAAALQMRSWVPRVVRKPLMLAVRTLERRAERSHTLLLAEESYQERFAHQHPVVPNTVRVPPERPVASGRDRIVYIGKLSAARGCLEMLEIGRRMPEMRVQLIGPAEPSVRRELNQAHAAGDVEWLGFLPNDQALLHLPGALAGLALLHDEPNYARSLPTKLVEYMAHGLPVVTTPNQTSADLVHRSGGGFVVPFGDVAGAVSAISTLATDSDRREAMSQAGHAYVLRNRSWSVDGPEFAATIEQVARAALADRRDPGRA